VLDQSPGIAVWKVTTGMPAQVVSFIACVAELELGVPRAIPVTVCIACVAELELGVPRVGVPRGAICGQFRFIFRNDHRNLYYTLFTPIATPIPVG
jgi:hypothetical protein